MKIRTQKTIALTLILFIIWGCGDLDKITPPTAEKGEIESDASTLATPTWANMKSNMEMESDAPIQAAPARTKSDAEIQIDPKYIKVHKRKPIPFKPFDEMRDPKTGEKIDPNTVITLRNGKKLTARQYYDELNKLEKDLNAIGYSLRGPEKRVKLQEIVVDRAKLQQQAQKIIKSHQKSDRNATSIPLTLENFEKGHKEWTLDRTVRDARDFGRDNEIIPESIHRVKTWGDSIGNPATFSAYYRGRLELDGIYNYVNDNNRSVGVNGEVQAGGYVFNHHLEVARVTYSSNSSRDNGQVKLKASVLGNSVGGFNGEGHEARLNLSIPLRSFDIMRASYRFSAGPIPMSATIGVRANLKVGHSHVLSPLYASATVEPTVNTNVYVEVAVDLVIAEAGAGGRLTLLDDKVTLYGRLRLDYASDDQEDQLYYPRSNINLSPGTPYLDGYYSCKNTITMLDGSLYLYAEVDLPWPLPDFRYEYELFSWDGISTTGWLFAKSELIPLT